ncbi:unnamed protein product [marine sediment metagenome]|uniref:Ribbon-helix-helix protein CopG domain-containing protein n=1 Tax=marine sediment metagenome TaxID=412755 RepID=X0SC71_9ZZZZ
MPRPTLPPEQRAAQRTFTLPARLLRQLLAHVPSGKRSRFVSEAIRHRLETVTEPASKGARKDR